MGKCVAYVAAAVVFLGIGALTAGLAVWYTRPDMNDRLPKESRSAQCILASTSGSTVVEGTITIHQNLPTSNANITGTIKGLTTGLHGFHVHTYGVAGATKGCKDAGGHYNPGGYNHAAPNDTERHVGDLGNIESDGLIADVQMFDHLVKLWGERSVVGRAIVVHAGEDDLGKGGESDSLTTGHAGGRVACCTIYIINDN